MWTKLPLKNRKDTSYRKHYIHTLQTVENVEKGILEILATSYLRVYMPGSV